MDRDRRRRMAHSSLAFRRYVHSLMVVVWSIPFFGLRRFMGVECFSSSCLLQWHGQSPCSIHPNTIALLGRPRHSQSFIENHVFRKATLHLTKQRRPCLETLLIRLPSSPLRLLLLCSTSVSFSDRAKVGGVCLNSCQDGHCTGSTWTVGR